MALAPPFQKNVEHHETTDAPHFMHYNFVRVHQTLRVTQPMEAGIREFRIAFGVCKRSSVRFVDFSEGIKRRGLVAQLHYNESLGWKARLKLQDVSVD
jgi:hypothetical protein